VTENPQSVHMTRHQVTPSHALISKLFDLLLLYSGCSEGLLIPPVDVVVSSASLLPVILMITIVVSISPVLVLVIIVASPVTAIIEVVVVESLLLMLLLVAVVLIVLLLVMLKMVLKTLLQLLLIGQARRIAELLLLLLHLGRVLLTLMLLLLLHLMLLGLSVSHAGVVEVMHGGVDVTHVTSVHGHGLGLLLLMHRRPRTSKHHLSLNVSERLHPWDGGRGELWPVGGLLVVLLELWRLLTHHLHLMLLRSS